MLARYLIKKLNVHAMGALEHMANSNVDWDIIGEIEQSLPKNIFRRTSSCLIVICYKFYLMGLNAHKNTRPEKKKANEN